MKRLLPGLPWFVAIMAMVIAGGGPLAVLVTAQAQLTSSVTDNRIIGRIGGQDIASKRQPLGPSTMPARIFERDEYMFAFFRIYLGSPRRDA